MTSALTQLYITLGTTPTFLFPCVSGYLSGFLSDFGIRPLDQLGIQVTLMNISKSFTLLLTNQRRITSGILYFMIVEFVGLFCPYMIFSACYFLRVGNTVVSDCSFIIMSIYPIFGPYYVLMSNTDYRNRVKGILKKAQELGSRSPTS
ncbi:unnamed protein product [Auanema sp. JU1783]|nr:unnamed protein product [Auanema sp. JU1783]